tara:strand:+ start:132 stop:752 length:621 start_codon:yes stop_codon:yes gene_type:complete
MAKNVNLNKDVFNKNTYPKVIDTKFKSLGTKTISEQVAEIPTTQEFFNMYNELFFSINQFGPTNSHEFLIKTSSEYINFDNENEIVKLLQAEIAILRQDLLESQEALSDFSKSIPGVDVSETSERSTSGGSLGDGSSDGSSDIASILIDVDNPTIPAPPSVSSGVSNENKVINDFFTYKKSSIRKRSKRLGLSKSFIRKVKKANNL